MKKIILFLSAVIFTFVLLSVSSFQKGEIPHNGIIIDLNQKYINDLSSNINLNNIDSVFSMIFSQLDHNVNVYPTENYFYFSFHTNRKAIWGNIRLPREERDKGILSFAYWEFDNFPQQPDDPNFFSISKKLSQEDGVSIIKVSPFEYSVSYKGKTVAFHLNQIEQKLPQSITLREGEVFVMRTCDESGLQFFLIFNRKSSDFIWLLDEGKDIRDDFINLDDDFLFGKRTQYVFYLDKENNRKVLMGVYAENIKKNNYFDGPFDQLADNYVDKTTKLKEHIDQAYPYASGRVNEYGAFIDAYGKSTDVRIAITPYYTYYSMDDLLGFIKGCRSYTEKEEFYSHLIYDYKKSVPR